MTAEAVASSPLTLSLERRVGDLEEQMEDVHWIMETGAAGSKEFGLKHLLQKVRVRGYASAPKSESELAIRMHYSSSERRGTSEFRRIVQQT